VERLSCGVPVGPDEKRGLLYAINSLRSAAELASCAITYNVALDPKLDSSKSRKKILDALPGQIVQFVSVPESAMVRSPNSCGHVHGEMLQALLDSAGTELFCVFDADTAFLMRDWDKFLTREMDASPRLGRLRRVIVGAESPLDNKYREFPTSMFFTVRTREFRELDVQMNKNKTSITKWPGYGPEKGGKGWVQVTDESQRLYCRPPGTKLYMDTGFEMLPAVRSSPYDWAVFRAVSEEGNEWYFAADGRPILTHMTGSYVSPWDSKASRAWRARIDQVVAGERYPGPGSMPAHAPVRPRMHALHGLRRDAGEERK
jgi:hypothetical protein